MRHARVLSRSRTPAQAGVRGAAVLSLLMVLPAGCGADAPARDDRVRGVLDGVELTLEVADDGAERSVGLQHRASVPPGTGMVFVYDEPVTGRYWMYDVQVPLRAVFVRDGRVVWTVVMPPCESEVAQSCPTYGPDEPYDTVVETAPETLPDVQPGDRLELDL